MTGSFTIYAPTGDRLPIVAGIPHSGLLVPDEIFRNLSDSFQKFLPNQDWHVDKLYDFLPDLGVTVLQANYSRYVVDLNRALQDPLFGNFWRSPITATTPFKAEIYQTPPSEQEIEERIATYYQPYHQQLQELLDSFIQEYGQVYLLDLHSFFGLITDEICLGNGNDKTCSEFFIASVEKAFSDRGYQVVRNKVFNGGYIARHYGEQPQIEALQIEVRYPVYLNAAEIELPQIPNWQVPECDRAKENFRNIFQAVCREIISFRE